MGTHSRDSQQFDAWTHQPLLISMEQGGIDWPSSCRNGTCRTCFGKLESGQVRYEIEWPGLSSEEKEEGFVLPAWPTHARTWWLHRVTDRFRRSKHRRGTVANIGLTGPATTQL